MFKVSRLIDVHLNSQIQIPLRKILNEAFEDDFSEEDWQHTYGGVRFLGHLDGHLISHGAVVPRKMQVDGASMLVGYVEGIAVSPGFQRKGFRITLNGGDNLILQIRFSAFNALDR